MIKEYSVTVEYDHEQYWQGHGTSCTGYDWSVTGCASTLEDAIEDLFEQVAMSGFTLTEAQEKDIKEQAMPDINSDDELENEEFYYYVSLDLKE